MDSLSTGCGRFLVSSLSSLSSLGVGRGSGRLGSSGTASCDGRLRRFARPRSCEMVWPSSSTATSAADRRLLLAALRRRMFLTSASRSRRFRSRRCSLRCSFSIRSAHHPARGSHRWESTFSTTSSTLTPALFIRCRVVFSNGVVNGEGRGIFRIACCSDACSERNGWARISLRLGRIRGRFDSSRLMSDLASSGNLSLNTGSSERILVLVTWSSSSSNGNSPLRSAYKMIPRLHTSTFSPAYFSPLSISGAL